MVNHAWNSEVLPRLSTQSVDAWVRGRLVFVCLFAVLIVVCMLMTRGKQQPSQGGGILRNATGWAETLWTPSEVDRQNPFFLSLGTTQRQCAACHKWSHGGTIVPHELRRRFDQSLGLDPIFRPHDGAVSPVADASTLELRERAYSMLLTKGLIRIGLPVPAGAEFTLERVDDPYGFASAEELSLFRRPPPVANLVFLRTVMWDGRESVSGQDLVAALKSQANQAVVNHTKGQQFSDEHLTAIVRAELSPYTAQVIDQQAGILTDRGARGGAQLLRVQAKSPVSSDPPSGAVFQLFDAWAATNGRDPRSRARREIARGESLFNQLACASCHNAPNAGNHAKGALFDTGVSEAVHRTPDLPLYGFRCRAGSMTGRLVESTDPGQGLVTGRCEDIGKFKVPILRGLAPRAPYFHNGMASTLTDVVDYYDRTLGLGLSAEDRQALSAFLRAL